MADELDLGAESVSGNTPAVANPVTETPPDIRSAVVAALETQRSAAGKAQDAEPETKQPVVANEAEKPAAEAAKPAGERQRGPDGKFLAVDSETEQKPQTEKPVNPEKPEETEEKPDEKPEDETTKTIRPPPGWSPKAKVAFDNLPAEVKEAVAKREEEVSRGFAKYSGVDRFVKMAEEGGTTLPQALEAYTGIEQKLRANIFEGVDLVLRNAGTSLPEFVAKYSERFGGAPQQAQPGTQQPTPQQSVAHQPRIDPQEIATTAQRAAIEALEQREVAAQIASFSADPKNRFFDNVKPFMSQLIESGRATSLQDAYDKACWSDPEIRDLLIKEQTAAKAPVIQKPDSAAQARQAARATVGAPSPGFAPKPASEPVGSVRDEALKALRRQQGIS